MYLTLFLQHHGVFFAHAFFDEDDEMYDSDYVENGYDANNPIDLVEDDDNESVRNDATTYDLTVDDDNQTNSA